MATTPPTLPTRTNPDRIRALREATGLSQDALAEKANVARMTLSKLERQSCDRVDHFVLQRLARELGADDLNDLLETA